MTSPKEFSMVIISIVMIVLVGGLIYYASLERPTTSTTTTRTSFEFTWVYSASIEDLITVLTDEDEDVGERRWAAHELSDRAEGFVKYQIYCTGACLTATKSPYIRLCEDIRDPLAVNGLIAALKDEDWFVRRTAAQALGKIRDPSTVNALVTVLENENEKLVVRAETAASLAQIAGPDAESAVRSFAGTINLQEVWQDRGSHIKKAEVSHAFYYKVVSADPNPYESGMESESLLVLLLWTHDNKGVNDLLNCDNFRLRDEATIWAYEHGYNIIVKR